MLSPRDKRGKSNLKLTNYVHRGYGAVTLPCIPWSQQHWKRLVKHQMSHRSPSWMCVSSFFQEKYINLSPNEGLLFLFFSFFRKKKYINIFLLPNGQYGTSRPDLVAIVTNSSCTCDQCPGAIVVVFEPLNRSEEPNTKSHCRMWTTRNPNLTASRTLQESTWSSI